MDNCFRIGFSTPVIGTAAAVDGNNNANRSVKSPVTITGLSIANGATFTLRWVDASGSSSSGMGIDDFSITACAAPSITSATAGANPICANATTTLTATVTGTNPSVTWWTGPNGTGTQVGTGLVSDPVGPGTYHAYATGDCGTDDEIVIVTGQAAPNAGTNGTLTICSSTTLTTTLLAAQLGGTPDPGGNWTPALAGAGVYTYTVTGTSPCPNASATVTVSVQATPTATIAYSAATYTTADAAQSVNITGTPNTGTFSAPAGLSINTATGQITPSTSTPATYLVTYTVAASGACPVYTTTTSVTINLYVATPLDCATPLNFSSPVVLSPTQAPNVWYTDRYAPNGFAISNDLGGSTLKHSINAADGEGLRPGGFNTAFYNTQGRKYDLEANSATLKIKLYVPASWATSNKRMAGLWGTAFDKCKRNISLSHY
ncbi:MAG: hypothetical protein IPO68_10455 [Chitinophagaceae bacterium]|nr:hypothetical protein [Chitinophagaceae bacterium]